MIFDRVSYKLKALFHLLAFLIHTHNVIFVFYCSINWSYFYSCWTISLKTHWVVSWDYLPQTFLVYRWLPSIILKWSHCHQLSRFIFQKRIVLRVWVIQLAKIYHIFKARWWTKVIFLQPFDFMTWKIWYPLKSHLLLVFHSTQISFFEFTFSSITLYSSVLSYMTFNRKIVERNGIFFFKLNFLSIWNLIIWSTGPKFVEIKDEIFMVHEMVTHIDGLLIFINRIWSRITFIYALLMLMIFKFF